ncbi:hypothetical protein [Brevifollis gellanilyticus]|uniref:Uncharacterized protein n=1 Tax=Brevifollis gellanilyticus TaxID=748831 RepID=A0A512M427_9BACT|nr:hypothetical protein [Brevifollis gellanilyticus]GEP41482.1 hypothetical protein BGE01nite_07730 [Brevifollis gellanilyticus]
MKSKLITTLISLLAAAAFAHNGVERGPNGGRILEFSNNETMHGEVTAKDGEFRVALLDKDMKPVSIKGQTLSAIKGDRDNPEKLKVEVKENHFVVPMLKGDSYVVILQYKENDESKKITARLPYNSNLCDGCDEQEWLCKCPPPDKKK